MGCLHAREGSVLPNRARRAGDGGEEDRAVLSAAEAHGDDAVLEWCSLSVRVRNGDELAEVQHRHLDDGPVAAPLDRPVSKPRIDAGDDHGLAIDRPVRHAARPPG